MRKKQIVNFSFIFFIFLLVGCNPFQSTPEKIHEVLERVVEKEVLFEEQQEPLVRLEKDEQQLYGEIMNLGTKNMEQIVEKSDQAIKIVEKRKVHMENEQKSLKESKQEFIKIKPLIDKLDESQSKDKAEELYSVMIERYKTHEVLHSSYMKGLEQDEQLYSMLKAKERSLDKLEAQIVKINKTYEEVMAANERFNKLTKDYNEIKHEFYEFSGLEVEKEATK